MCPPWDDSGDPVGSQVLQKYLDAKVHTQDLRGASMEVEISANVPKLKENGKLRALRVISRVGQVTYRVAAFQGPNFVKKEIIARYLQAETARARTKKTSTLTPQNYKFRFRGRAADAERCLSFCVSGATPKEARRSV